MKNLPSLIFCVAIISFFGCKKKAVPALPPNVLLFLITKDGNRLPDSTLDKISLYYLENGNKISSPPGNLDDKKFLFPATRYSGQLEGEGVLGGSYIDWLVYERKASNLYLEYPDGDVDTLHIEISHIGDEEGVKDRCYCAYPFTIVKFNGKDAPETTDIKSGIGKPIYLFEK